MNAISAGLVATRAGKGIGAFPEMFARYEASKPLPSPLTIEDVGHSAAFLAGDGAKSITGTVHFVDAGYHITD